MSKNISELTGRKGIDNNLFDKLGQIAVEKGSISHDELEKLAEEFLLGTANVYSSTTFYDFLRPENQGKKAYVCNGSACLTAGTQKQVTEKLEKVFSAEEIGKMCCLGRCHENKAFHVNGKNYSGDDIEQFSASNTKRAIDQYQVANYGTAVITSAFPGIDTYYAALKDWLRKDPSVLLEELKVSGLRGRGGAGFPMSIKIETCRATESNVRFVVCNADEGDPGAYSDRYILEQRPHALLLGMMMAGYMCQSSHGVLYIRAEYPEAIEVIEKEIENLRNASLLGKNILDSGFDFDFKIIKAQGAYICGEETALLNSIEGQRPEVRVRPPFPAQQGLFNKPTIVNNVETLACIPFILNNGGKAFAEIGRGRSTGTKLVSLDGFFKKPGIYEVDMGTPMTVVVHQLGGGFKEKIKAMHIGGPLGGLVPVHYIDQLSVDFESFNENGFLLGHASIVCIPETYPLIHYLEHLFEFTAHESCGKCFPCRLGSTRGYELLNKSIQSDYKIDRTLFNDLINTMQHASLCALGGGLPLPIKNALQHFDSELSPYFKT
ncbi:MAG TPA: NADH-ubiquinone oxidoreductase-F iron-sulfur binding region domain-containing protein [Bacteroidia bacterium]|nr:NADH-ubiquinone oxidoreductase-F iron-sulfur binding region domain-containing protein [Bacteroidia bacterium]